MPTALTPADLLTTRTSLGLTVDQFAAELGVTPHVYEAWEKGALAVPDYQLRIIIYRKAVAERQAALAASDLTVCSWMNDFEAQSEPRGQKAQIARYQELATHVKACQICIARDQFLQERFGPMPELPTPGWLRMLQGFSQRIGRLPHWSRPAAWGAILLGMLVFIRLLFFLPSALGQPSRLLRPLGALVVAMLAGAAGGLVYSFIGKPLRRVRVVGPYLAGVVTVFGYMAAIMIIGAVGGESMLNSRVDFVVFVALSALFGVVLGFSLFRHFPDD